MASSREAENAVGPPAAGADHATGGPEFDAPVTWWSEPRGREPLCASRTVIVPVGAFDRRAAVAIGYSELIPAAERRAMHVAVEDSIAERVGLAWMEARPLGPRLTILDDLGGVAATIAAHVAETLVSGADEVVVVLGQLRCASVRRRLLHDGTAASIGRAVEGLPHTVCVLLPVGSEP
jgi:hypothetical protein